MYEEFNTMRSSWNLSWNVTCHYKPHSNREAQIKKAIADLPTCFSVVKKSCHIIKQNFQKFPYNIFKNRLIHKSEGKSCQTRCQNLPVTYPAIYCLAQSCLGYRSLLGSLVSEGLIMVEWKLSKVRSNVTGIIFQVLFVPEQC